MRNVQAKLNKRISWDWGCSLWVGGLLVCGGCISKTYNGNGKSLAELGSRQLATPFGKVSQIVQNLISQLR